MRLIDADKVGLTDLEIMMCDGNYKTALIMLEEKIRTAPTIEVEPVKHGQWIPVTNGRGGFECSICHNYAPSYQDGVEWLSLYCPHCGAKMNTEEGEEA